MNEGQACRKAVYTRLTTHAGTVALVSTRVHHAIAPQGGPFPLVTFQQVADRPLYAIGNDVRIYDQVVMLIKGISEGPDDSAADAIAHQIDEAFGGGWSALTTVGGGTWRVQTVAREQQLPPVMETGGSENRRYWHGGGYFRFTVEPE